MIGKKRTIVTALILATAVFHLMPTRSKAFEPSREIRDVVRGQPYLMLNDGSIDRSFGVRKRFHSAKRHGSPVLEPTEPWMNHNVYIYGSVIHDRANDVYRMWYFSTDRDAEPSRRVLYAESADGYDWKPVMEGMTIDGERTNILPEVHGHNASVVSLSGDDGAPPYRAFWWMKSRTKWHGAKRPSGSWLARW